MGNRLVTRLIFHPDRATIPAATAQGEIPVWLFGPSPPFAHAGSVGASVMEEASRLTVRPSAAAVDLVAIAMAVTAADTFVDRSKAANGWARDFEIILPLKEPDRWRPLVPVLARTLNFLSGDHWHFELQSGGAPPPPQSEIRRRLRTSNLATLDCVTLFSGGLDSMIGALDLIAQGLRPLLVSHAPRGDAERQKAVSTLLPQRCQRLSVNSYPTWSGFDDDSMRTRSFQFLSIAALAAQALSQFRGGKTIDLYLCENGFIALNPPLTVRRLGSLSTRTAHPHFLDGVRALLDGAGLPVRIINPYRHMTKGEMVRPHRGAQSIVTAVAETVSCGKWKRRNQQCGRCLPCIIRRASLHAAGVNDTTSYQVMALQNVLASEDERDDVISIQTLLRHAAASDLKPLVLKGGPLPVAATERAAYFAVAERGCAELRAFLLSQGLKV